MAEVNPCCGEGMLDREREPCFIAKAGWCGGPSAMAYWVHYNGSENKMWVILTLIWPILGLFAPWELKQPGDNPSTNPDENEMCSKGCLDRERQPPMLAKGLFVNTACHYSGLFGCPGILMFIPGGMIIQLFMTFPTIGAKPMVGAPQQGSQYGAA